MRLFELAYACRVYGHLTGYDAQLVRLRKAVGPALDPSRLEHRLAMFKWLNSWGCRQFAKAHHGTTASDSLTERADAWFAKLPAAERPLTELSEHELDESAKAYAALNEQVASYRALSRGRSTPVAYGATGAARVLFARRPNAYPPWDDPIRDRLRFDDGAAGYRGVGEHERCRCREFATKSAEAIEVSRA